MSVRGRIAAKAQIKVLEFRRDMTDSDICNMLLSNRYRMPKTRVKTDIGEIIVKQNEQKYAAEKKKLGEPFVCPHFVKRPVDTCILSQRMGTIEARISGVPKPEVKWYKNGQLISDRMYPRIKIRHYEPNIYILEIRDALMPDMGLYTLIAQNCYGTIISSANVRIARGLSEVKEYPQIIKRLEGIDVNVGYSDRLEVRVTGKPKPDVKWYKNWIPLKEDDRIKIRHYDPDNYVLFIKNAKPEDAGLYTCKARNDVGTRSTSAMVYVEGNKNLAVCKPMTRLPHDFISDNEWSDDLTCIRRQLERRESILRQKEKNDFAQQRTIATLLSSKKIVDRTMTYCNLRGNLRLL